MELYIKYFEFFMAYTGQRQKINTTAFGEIAVAEVTPQIQLQFPLGINPNYITTSVVSAGTVTSSPPFAVVQSGASATSSASFQSLDYLHYRPGEGAALIFTALFTSGVAGSQQYVGLGDSYNGFFFGWNGSTFGILYRQQVYGATVTASTITDTWIYQNAWNGDPFNGTGGSGVTLNSTLGNIYKIQMQWLGFGAINFYIENGAAGNLVLVHQIKNANLFTNTSLSNPTLPVTAKSLNTSNTSNVILKVPSIGAFVEGTFYQNNIRYSTFGSNNGFVSDNLVLSIQNMYTYNNETVAQSCYHSLRKLIKSFFKSGSFLT